MIEDDIRGVIGQALAGVDVYARLIPSTLPDCVTIQSLGGTPSTSSIRRATHRISVMACTQDRGRSIALCREARDALITACPFDTANAHYYNARAMAEGSIKKVTLNGPSYIEFVDMEVLVSL